MPATVVYREIYFMHNGTGPWKCAFCDEVAYMREYRRTYKK